MSFNIEYSHGIQLLTLNMNDEIQPLPLPIFSIFFMNFLSDLVISCVGADNNIRLQLHTSLDLL